MQIVEALSDSVVLDNSGRTAFELHAGRRCVLHDHEAAEGLRSQAIKLIGTLDRTIPPYRGEKMIGRRLMFPFIGGLGDAIVTASCLASLVERYPDTQIDIACRPHISEVFDMLPSLGSVVPYPFPADRLTAYSYHLSFEDIGAVGNGQRRSYGDVYSTCLHTPPPSALPSVEIPYDAQSRQALSQSSRARVAIHLGRGDNLRSIPIERVSELADALTRQGIDVYVVGSDQTRDPRLSSVGVRNLTGRTPSSADLAAVLAQMQVLVTGDSFPLHLAGAIGTPTVAFFTATDSVIASDYPSVLPIASRAACSPCFVAGDRCPLDHVGCPAHWDASLSTNRIASCVSELLAPATTGHSMQS